MKVFLSKVLINFKYPNKLVTCIVILLVFFGSSLLYSYSFGPAAGGLSATGAPFLAGGSTCNNCHGGGNFGASIQLQLLDENNIPVTQYTPGKSYTYRIGLNNTSGGPMFGFQATAVKQAGNANINNWGSLPSGIQNTTLNGRNFIEHNQALSDGEILLPFTAPASGSGTMTFYTAGNIVDGSGGTSGDQVVNSSLSITENINLPVSLLYFKGFLKNEKAMLTWAAASESNSKWYSLEKSVDGVNFVWLANISSKNQGAANYQYNDLSYNGSTFYRLSQTDFDGKKTVFNVVNVKKTTTPNYSIAVASNGGLTQLIFNNDAPTQHITIQIIDLQGKVLYGGKHTVNFGKNILPIPTGLMNGMAVVKVIASDRKITTAKVFLQR